MDGQEQATVPLGMCVLVVSNKTHEDSAVGRATRALIEDMRHHDAEVIVSLTADDGRVMIDSDPHLQAVVLDWDLHRDSGHCHAADLLRAVRARNASVPVFLLAERNDAAHVPAEVMGEVDEFIWLLQDTMEFIAERVVAAVRRYRVQLLPPMFGALVKFAREAEYSWHTPGHTGGTAFLRSPVGRMFYDYFGENLLRSDLSISVGELGSLLDHSGPIGEGERYAAHVFGADRTYYVTNGTSTSNRVVMMANVARGQIVLADRNCHKSVEHGLSMTGAVPVYLMPHRNYLGLIGPIPSQSLSAASIANNIANSPLAAGVKEKPALAIVTNSTYDGLCINAAKAEELLGASVDRILFDEAWFAYARFNPLYKDRFAMRGDLAPGAARRPHRVCHAIHAQAAGGTLAGLNNSSARGALQGRACALQRGVHDARLDLAAICHHRVHRCQRRDDGWRRRAVAHGRGDCGGDLLPPDHGAVAGGFPCPRRLVLRRLAARDCA